MHPTRGHSTTTWTEFCHFLTPCVDSFYTLSVDKNRHFLTPSTHPVHVVVECPLTFSSHSNFFNAERLPNSIIELCCNLIFKTWTYSLESISPFLFSEFEGQQKNKEALIFDRLMTIDFIVFGKGQEISEDFFCLQFLKKIPTFCPT